MLLTFLSEGSETTGRAVARPVSLPLLTLRLRVGDSLGSRRGGRFGSGRTLATLRLQALHPDDVDGGLQLREWQVASTPHQLALLRRQLRNLGNLGDEGLQLLHGCFGRKGIGRLRRFRSGLGTTGLDGAHIVLLPRTVAGRN